VDIVLLCFDLAYLAMDDWDRLKGAYRTALACQFQYISCDEKNLIISLLPPECICVAYYALNWYIYMYI
jgi:hypothetical protein